MKKKINTIITIILYSAVVWGQNTISAGETSLVNVVYDFYHINDLNNRSNINHQEMILSVGKVWSNYQNFENIKSKIKARKALEDMIASGNIRAGGTVRGGLIVSTYTDNRMQVNYYQKMSDKELHSLESVGRNVYLIRSKLPIINWAVKNEKKKLGDFEVQRAEGEFAGRKYIAWFCTDVPFSNGPWKLSGLPGLILEAQDEKGEVKFIFKEIYKDEETTKLFYSGSEKDVIVANENQLNRLKSAFSNDPLGTISSQGIGNITESNIRFVDDDGTSTSGANALEKIKEQQAKRKLRKENPLELTK